MVMDNHSYKEQTERLLAETRDELNALEDRIDTLVDRRIQLAREAEAYTVALEGYLRRTGKHLDDETDWKHLLTELKHKDKVVAIAQHKGGKIRVSDAVNILYGGGFIKAKKRSTAYTMVQVYLAEMKEEGKFTKIQLGEYQLVGAQQSLLATT